MATLSQRARNALRVAIGDPVVGNEVISLVETLSGTASTAARDRLRLALASNRAGDAFVTILNAHSGGSALETRARKRLEIALVEPALAAEVLAAIP